MKRILLIAGTFIILLGGACKKQAYRSQDVYDVALQMWVNAHDTKAAPSQKEDFLVRAQMEAKDWSKILKRKPPAFSDPLWFETIIVEAMPEDVYAQFQAVLAAQLKAASETVPKKLTRKGAVLRIKEWDFLNRFYDKRYGFNREN